MFASKKKIKNLKFSKQKIQLDLEKGLAETPIAKFADQKLSTGNLKRKGAFGSQPNMLSLKPVVDEEEPG